MMPGENQAKGGALAFEATSGACQNCTALNQSLNEYVTVFLTLKQKIIETDNILSLYKEKCEEFQQSQRLNGKLQQQLDEAVKKLQPLEQKAADYEQIETKLRETEEDLKSSQRKCEDALVQKAEAEESLRLAKASVQKQEQENEKLKEENRTLEDNLQKAQDSHEKIAEELESFKLENAKVLITKGSLENELLVLKDANNQQNGQILYLKSEKNRLEESVLVIQERLDEIETLNKDQKSVSVQTEAETLVDKGMFRKLLDELWHCIESPSQIKHHVVVKGEETRLSQENSHHKSPLRVPSRISQQNPGNGAWDAISMCCERPSLNVSTEVSSAKASPRETKEQRFSVSSPARSVPSRARPLWNARTGDTEGSRELFCEDSSLDLEDIQELLKPLPVALSPLHNPPADSINLNEDQLPCNEAVETSLEEMADFHMDVPQNDIDTHPSKTHTLLTELEEDPDKKVAELTNHSVDDLLITSERQNMNVNDESGVKQMFANGVQNDSAEMDADDGVDDFLDAERMQKDEEVSPCSSKIIRTHNEPSGSVGKTCFQVQPSVSDGRSGSALEQMNNGTIHNQENGEQQSFTLSENKTAEDGSRPDEEMTDPKGCQSEDVDLHDTANTRIYWKSVDEEPEEVASKNESSLSESEQCVDDGLRSEATVEDQSSKLPHESTELPVPATVDASDEKSVDLNSDHGMISSVSPRRASTQPSESSNHESRKTSMDCFVAEEIAGKELVESGDEFASTEVMVESGDRTKPASTKEIVESGDGTKLASTKEIVESGDGTKLASTKEIVESGDGFKLASTKELVESGDGNKSASTKEIVEPGDGTKLASTKEIVESGDGSKLESTKELVESGDGNKSASTKEMVESGDGTKLASIKDKVELGDGTKLATTKVVESGDVIKPASTKELVESGDGTKLASTKEMVESGDGTKRATPKKMVKSGDGPKFARTKATDRAASDQATSDDNTNATSTLEAPGLSLGRVRTEMGPPLPPLVMPLTCTPPRSRIKALPPQTSSGGSPDGSKTPNTTISEGPASRKASCLTPSSSSGLPPSPLQFGSATPKHAVPVPCRLPSPVFSPASPSSQENSMQMLDTMYPELSAQARTLNILRGNVSLSRAASENGASPPSGNQILGSKMITSSATAFTKTEQKLKRPSVNMLLPRSAKRLRLDNSSPAQVASGSAEPVSQNGIEVQEMEMKPSEEKSDKVIDVSHVLDTLKTSSFDLLPVVRSHVFIGRLSKVPVLIDEEKDAIGQFTASQPLAEDALCAILTKLKCEKAILSRAVLQALCRVYAGVCRQFGDYQKAHAFAYSILKEDVPHAPELILFMVTTWPAVFSHGNCLCRAIHTVAKLRAREEVLEFLSKYLHWDTNPPDEIQQLLSDTVKSIKEDEGLTFSSHDRNGHDLCPVAWEFIYTLDLLCSHMKWKWTHDFVIGKELWPIMNTWVTQPRPQQAPIRDVSVAAVLRLIGRLGQLGMKQKLCKSVQNVAKALNLFAKHGIAEGVPAEVQLSAVYAIYDLAPCNPKDALDALASWRSETTRPVPPAVTSCITRIGSLFRNMR